ncbi:hypothetical protein SLEP1_g17728 [Rubroshorea leprosula]|uniref:DUF7086 domain-containing protein n=1 Tax=Rubroshorea leprosula TaxID=152421 RepID=A0AAV5J5T7_9ROSI|nr:hypothetical protein SLEP1_g17728 [Rubroshorea leprosula]
MPPPIPFHQFSNQDDPLALTLGLPHVSLPSTVPLPQQIPTSQPFPWPVLGQPFQSPLPPQPLYDLRPTPPPPPASNHQFYTQMETVNPNPNVATNQDTAGGSSRTRRGRRACSKARADGKSETINPPYPWARNQRSMIYSLEYLLSKGITKISGEVKCKRCDKKFQMEYDLVEKFREIASYISRHRSSMHDRAPAEWMNPTLPGCVMCKQTNCVKPVIAKKRAINWLFLLLGRVLGCCKLSELKYFCKHTENHRTGAKDRVLYLTYLGLCKQLDPSGPFDLDL